METVITIITVILVFCALILSHELGHFSAARACGIYVEDFSLGMGPKLLQKKSKKGTTYTLRLLPIGGWCNMRGEDEDSTDPRGFNNKKVWQRMVTIAAGPIANFLFAIILFVLAYMIIGTASEKNIVGEPLPDTPAYSVLQEGDIITEINGTAISQWSDISAAVNAGEAGATINMTVERAGESISVAVEPYFNETDQQWKVGIYPATEHLGFFTAIGMGFENSMRITVEIIRGLFQMITGQIEPEVAGPVGIVQIIGQSTSEGFTYILQLTALLSINLGLINLFPLPALDGSRLVFLAIEGIRRKPISRAKEGMVHFIGLILLMGLMVVITINDIIRLASGT